MKGGTRMRIAPISVYDVAAQQAWLEDMAAKGELLSARGGGFAGFCDSAPKEVRYRMEPLARREDCPDLDRREVYRSLGWEYVCTVKGSFHIWRCDDPAAPELETDPVVQGMAYNYQRRMLRRGGFAVAAVWAVPILLALYFQLTMRGAYFSRLVESWTPAWEALALLAALVFALSQALYWGLSFRRFVRALERGMPQPRRRPYRVSRLLGAAALAVYALFLVSRCAALVRPSSRPFVPVDDLPGPVPCVSMAQLDPAAETDGPLAAAWQNWLTAEQWWTVEDLGDSDCTSRYYRLWLPALAEPLEKSLVASCRESGADMVPASAEGLDSAWTGSAGNGLQYLVVRRDGQLVRGSVRLDGDISEHLDAYAALLAEFA